MWQINIFMFLPVFLTIIFIIFTIKATRWEDRKSLFVLLIINIFLAIFSSLVILGVYKASHQPLTVTVPTGPPPGFPGDSLPPPNFGTIEKWAYLALISEILSILTFVIGLVYFLIKRSKIKKS